MWSLGHPARHYTDWVPAQSPADRPPRLYVRTAAGAPLQSTQLLQENDAVTNDVTIGDVLPLVAPRRRPGYPIPGREHHHHEPATARLAPQPASQPQPSNSQPVILDIELPLGPDVAPSQRPVSEPRASREPRAVAPGVSHGVRGANSQTTTQAAPPGALSLWLQAEPSPVGRCSDASIGFFSSTSSATHYLLDLEALIRVMVGSSLPQPPSAGGGTAPPEGPCNGTVASLPTVAGIDGVRLFDSPEELLRGLDRLLPDCTAPDTGTSSGGSSSPGPGAAAGGGGATAASSRARGPPANGGGHDVPPLQRPPPQPQLQNPPYDQPQLQNPPYDQPQLQNPPYDQPAPGLLYNLMAAIAPSSPLDSLRGTPGLGSGTGNVHRREATATAAPGVAAFPAQAAPSSPPPFTSAAQARSGQRGTQGILAAGTPTTTTTNNNSNNNNTQVRRDGRAASSSSSSSEMATFTPQGRPKPTATAAAAAAAVVAAAPLLGPTAFDVIARGPAAASLVCGAAGIAVPPWARGLLPPPAGPGLRLDPALEWALGVLSWRVSPAHPVEGDLRLANRTLAAHLGPRRRQVEGLRWRRQRRQPHLQHAAAEAGSRQSGAPGRRGGEGARAAPAAAAAAVAAATAAGVVDSAVGTGSSGAGAGAGASSRSPSSSAAAAAAVALPWPLLLPLVGVIGDRLDVAGALALLRGLTRQVSPAWRLQLPPRQQDHLAATVRALLVAALRNPYDISPSAAAGLLAVMARLNVRSSAACRLLVERLLQPEPHRLRHCNSSPSPSESRTSSSPNSSPRSRSRSMVTSSSMEPPLPSAQKGTAMAAVQHPSSAASDPRSDFNLSFDAGFGSRSRSVPGSGATSGSGSGSVRDAEEGEGWRDEGGMRQRQRGQPARRGRGAEPTEFDCHVRLRWVMMALGSLARLRLDHKGLPHRGVARLVRCALWREDELTPADAAALLVFAARLSNFLPYALIRRYRMVVLRPRRLLRRVSLVVQPDAANSCDRSGKGPTRGSTPTGSTRGAARAVANPSAAAPRIPRSSLLARMHGSQLAAALEALDALYGRPLGAAAALRGSGAADDDGGVAGDVAVQGRTAEGPKAAAERALRTSVGSLAAALASALTRRRLRQLRRQQACRLPLVLLRLGGGRGPAGPRVMSRVQAIAAYTRHLLGGCDAVDVMLLLSGLRRAVEAAAPPPPSTSSLEDDCPEAGATTALIATPSSSSPTPSASLAPPLAPASLSSSIQPVAAMSQSVLAAWPPGRPNTLRGVRRQRRTRPSAATATTAAAAAAATTTATCLYADVADDALRRYLAVLPQASLRHTAAVLQSLGVLWSCHHDLLMAAPGPATTATTTPSRAFPSAATTTIAGVTTIITESTSAAAATADEATDPATAGPSAGAAEAASAVEVELRRRRLADLVSERDFLLQQLDEHLTACFLRSPSSLVSGGGGGGALGFEGRSAKGDRHRRSELEVSERAKWAIMVLSAYGRLHHPPPPGLQAALEDVLVARAETLGSAGWAEVRRAYEGLRLQPGRRLSVAMVTFA